MMRFHTSSFVGFSARIQSLASLYSAGVVETVNSMN
jgi:hypothetical protein